MEDLTNLTPRFQQVLVLARKKANEFGHNFIGTEHLLLGIIGIDECMAVKILKEMSTPIPELEKKLIGMFTKAPKGSGEDVGLVPFTPRSKKVFNLAKREAVSMDHDYIGTEHLLLGLLREGDGLAAKVLRMMDADSHVAKATILRYRADLANSAQSSEMGVQVILKSKNTSSLRRIAKTVLLLNPEDFSKIQQKLLGQLKIEILDQLVREDKGVNDKTDNMGSIVDTATMQTVIISAAKIFADRGFIENCAKILPRYTSSSDPVFIKKIVLAEFEKTIKGSVEEVCLGLLLQKLSNDEPIKVIREIAIDFNGKFNNLIQEMQMP